MIEAAGLGRVSRAALKALPVTMFLYVLSIFTSMAGMEIFGWLSAILVVVVLVAERNRNGEIAGGFWTPLDVILLGFFVVVAIGAAFVGPEGPGYVTIVGRVRWIFLFMLLRLGLRWIWKDKLEMLQTVLIGFMGIVGIYAVFQHFFGIDLLREGNRAVVPLSHVGNELVPLSWRAAGFFSSPMTYAHSAALFVGFPVALFMLKVKANRDLHRFVGICTVLILIGIFFSFVRGAWIAVAASLAVIGLFAGVRAFLATAVIAVIITSAGYFTSSDIQRRMQSFVNPQFRSNVERINLWKANWEMFKENPVIGVGYGENERLSKTYFQKLGITGFSGHAHNNLFQVLSGTGILGTLFFVAFGLYTLYVTLRLWWMVPIERTWDRSLVLGLLGAQVAMHVGGLTECNFKDGEVNHHYMFLMAILMTLYHRYASERSMQIVRPKDQTRPLNQI